MSQYQEIIDDLRAAKYDFRINDLDESLEVRHGRPDWERLNDTTIAILKTDMREIGYGGKKKPGLSAMLDAMVKLAHQNRYNPIKDYFDGLTNRYKPSPNGPYIIPTLATYFKNPDGKFGDWLFKWMTGAIAKIYHGERNAMLVLVAPQYIGKSFFVGWLCPPRIKDRFIKSSINPDNKDAALRLADTFIWEVEELGATTRRADIEALKAFITKPFIFERPPYGRHPIHKIANANFIGTVNFDGAGFLNDPTGSTRFLACEIEHIDWQYSQLNVDDLWGEAFWFYKHLPGCWELSSQDKTDQARINAKFEIVSALADVVEDRYDITLLETDFVSTQDLRTHLAQYYRIQSEQAFYNELGRVLTKLGCKSGRQKHSEGGKRGYYGLERRKVENE